MNNENVDTALYGRCSTDDIKQDVNVQIDALKKYCDAYGYTYEVFSEYGSGYKGEQPELNKLLERIRKGEFKLLMVYSLDRFSREHPSKVNALLDKIVYQYKCRFISLLDNIDSNNEMSWLIMKNMMTYFAHIYSRNLSKKVKEGIQHKKALGLYKGGRRNKIIDVEGLKSLYEKFKSLRKTADEYNKDKPKKEQISYVSVKKTLSKFKGENLQKEDVKQRGI